ncbi:MAG: ATP-binding cassette domain-containing protein [Zoogloeaceae bacterium]|jgi:putative ABC transport system ATP-binding protein|nr:ATP-binding cassette domain-containing protein [Zoogloeaceae bacterium]
MPLALEISDLVFQQGNFRLALPHLSLPAGGSLFVRGASGSGKTTLLNLLSGALRQDAGRVLLLGQDFGAWNARRRDAFRADHLGIIFQQFNLLPWASAFENVLLPCRFSRFRAQRAGTVKATAARLLQALDLAPAVCQQKAATLSVGQQQRVAAARALIGTPEILLADEPTSALDAARQAGFLELLLCEAKRAGSAVIFASHDLTLARQFDQVLELAA